MFRFDFLKTVLPALLSLALILGAFVILPPKGGVEVSADSGFYTWSGKSTYLKGAGTEDNPFLISSPSDLAYFRTQVALSTGTITYYTNNNISGTEKTKDADNSYYKLTCDIYYNDPNGDEWKSWSSTVKPTNGGGSVHTWTPPGYGDETNRRFEGGFDGDGHTIYGLYIVHSSSNCVGFLGTARYATIENLTLAKGYVEGAIHTGGFIGQAKVGVDVVNCVSNLNVVGTKAVGGFIGGNAKNGSSVDVDVDVSTEASIPSVVLYGCENNSKVTGAKWIGGVMGYVSSGASRVQIENCVNTGNVSASNAGAGGILGGNRQVDGYGHNSIDGCSNSGTISGGTNGYTGGIVGCGRSVDVYSCVNTGTVKNTVSGNYTAGICGGTNTADPLANSRVYYCYNSGTVSGASYTGGIVGCGKSLNINSCANVGAVKGTSYVGGISGRSSGTSDIRDSEIYDCYNTASVTSTNNSATVAGIVGEAYFEGTVSDNKFVKVQRCINLGAVSSGNSISYTSSTVQNSAGTGIYAYTVYADTCFGLSGVNSSFNGGTSVSNLASSTVLAKLNSASANTWRAGYPFPTLNGIDYDLQNYGGRADFFSGVALSLTSAPAISAKVTVNTAGSYYGSLSGYSLSYGVLAVKSHSLEGSLTADTAGAVKLTGSLSGGQYTATLSSVSIDEYDDMFTLRPYAAFTVGGHTVYVYGDEAKSSFYTASGAKNVAAVNNTAAFTCDNKLFVLVGEKNEISCSLSSASREDSISFISSNPSVATVSKGVVTGVSAGTATVTVTYTGAWGAETRYCTVTVMNDLTSNVLANQFAAADNNFRIRTNELHQIDHSISKNDGAVLDYNGTVFMVDGGLNNNNSLDYLLRLREEFLKDGLESGTLTEAQYYQYLYSDKCQVEFISLVTHWHSDHIYALRYNISQNPRVTVKKLYTAKDPTGTSASSYSSYISGFDAMVTAMTKYSPNFTPTQVSYESEMVRYFKEANAIAVSDTTYPVKLTICTPKDWSTVSAVNDNGTEWQNCSSTWFVFEVNGTKILFTGDTFAADIGTTYTGNTTSGTTVVDHMLSIHKGVVDENVDILECNHHGRGAFVANLFTATKPSIVFAGLYYGQEAAELVNKAVETADVYLAGEGEQIFVIDSAGNINTDDAICSYNKNTSGHAVRNRIGLHYNNEQTVKTATTTVAATGITLSSSTLTVVLNSTTWLSATVLGENATDKNVVWTVSDPTVLSVDGAYVKGLKVGTATVTAKCGSYSASCTVTVINVVGDVNGDGLVSVTDLLALRSIVSGDSNCTEDIRVKGDMDADGQISATDVLIMKKKLTDGK